MKTLVLIPQERYQQLLSKEINGSLNDKESIISEAAKENTGPEQETDQSNQSKEIKEPTALVQEADRLKTSPPPSPRPPPPGEPDLPTQLGGSGGAKGPKRKTGKKTVWQSRWTSY